VGAQRKIVCDWPLAADRTKKIELPNPERTAKCIVRPLRQASEYKKNIFI